MFVRSDLVDPANFHVDRIGMDAIGRLGGHLYARTRDQSEIVTPTPDGWTKTKIIARSDDP